MSGRAIGTEPRAQAGGEGRGLFGFAGGAPAGFSAPGGAPREAAPVEGAPAAKRNRPFVWTVLLVGVLALALATWMTQHGVGSPGDGLTYIGVAQNIVDGKGITQPFINEYDSLTPFRATRVIGRSPMLAWPPLYPLMLSSGRFVGLPLSSMARLIGVGSFALLAAGVAMLAGRAARNSVVAAAASGSMLLVSPHLLLLTTVSSTELVAAALTLPALLALPRVAVHGGRRLLALVWLSIVAASLTRIVYAGLPLAAAASILCLRPRRRGRWIDAGIVVTAVVPLGIWFVARSVVPSDRGADGYFPEWSSRLPEVGRAVRALVLPDGDLLQMQGAAMLFVVIIAVGLRTVAGNGAAGKSVAGNGAAGRSVAGGSVDGEGPRTRSWWRLAGADEAVATRVTVALAGLSILPVFLVALVTGGFALSIDARSLMPLQVPLVVAFAGMVAALRPTRRGYRLFRWAATAAAGLFAIVSVVSVNQPSFWLAEGVRPPQTAPRRDDALAAALAGHELVFADAPSIVYALTGHPAAMLPLTISPAVGKPRTNFGRDLDQLRQLCRDREVVFVFFDFAEMFNNSVPREQELVDQLGLRPLARLPGARVYRSAFGG